MLTINSYIYRQILSHLSVTSLHNMCLVSKSYFEKTANTEEVWKAKFLIDFAYVTDNKGDRSWSAWYKLNKDIDLILSLSTQLAIEMLESLLVDEITNNMTVDKYMLLHLFQNAYLKISEPIASINNVNDLLKPKRHLGRPGRPAPPSKPKTKVSETINDLLLADNNPVLVHRLGGLDKVRVCKNGIWIDANPTERLIYNEILTSHKQNQTLGTKYGIYNYSTLGKHFYIAKPFKNSGRMSSGIPCINYKRSELATLLDELHISMPLETKVTICDNLAHIFLLRDNMWFY